MSNKRYIALLAALFMGACSSCASEHDDADDARRTRQAGYVIGLAKIMCNVPEVRLSAFRVATTVGARGDAELEAQFMTGWRSAEEDYNAIVHKGWLADVRPKACPRILKAIDSHNAPSARELLDCGKSCPELSSAR